MNKQLILLVQPIGAIFLCGLLGFFIYGYSGAQWGCMLSLITIVFLHFRQLFKLLKWLQKPEPETIPFASGLLGEIFSTLSKQSKKRYRQKQKLRETLMRFKRASEALPSGIIIIDQNLHIEWQNRLSAHHFNLDREQIRQTSITEAIKLPVFQNFIQQNLQNQIRIVMPQQQHSISKTLLLTLCPFEKNTRILISQDISTIEQIQVSQTNFVANVSHELRTPLTVISGFLETLSNIPDLAPEQQQQFIGLMQKESSRMQELLDDLLNLSKLESQYYQEKNKIPVQLSLLVTQIADNAQTLSQGQHQIKTNITPDIYINGIQSILYSALSNIAFNAVRYTPSGGDIFLSLQKTSHNQVRFSVQDSGVGIAAEHIPHLTERFYRVDTSRSRQSGGTGLGLAIAKHALAIHQTQLEIHSEIGKGSEFATTFKISSLTSSS